MNISVEHLLEQYNIKYKDKGSYVVCKCLNPGHDDSTPSLSIRKADGLYNCFGCGFKGNYFTLYEFLTGNKIRKNKNSEWNQTYIEKSRKKSLPQIEIIGNLYSPLDNKIVREYLRSVGVYSDDFIKDYGIKYSVYSEMIAKHLLTKKDIKFTKVVNRVCTPIYRKNRLINMEARVYEDIETLPEGTPKVLYIKGGSVETLYNWENIDKSKPVVTTESVKNFWKIWNVYPNTVALFHAIPTKEQLKMLEEVDIIHFGDNDEGFFGKYEKDKVVRKGTLQVLAEEYSKDFRFCYDRRRLPNGKGYDANNCSLEEIDNHIKKAIYYSDYINKPKIKIINSW